MRGIVRAIGLILAVGLLCGCAQDRPVITPTESGAHRPDGVVSMSSTVSIFQPYAPDWSVAQAGADRRCAGWGYAQADSFTGSQELCRAWDKHGRCIEMKVTRYYECAR